MSGSQWGVDPSSLRFAAPAQEAPPPAQEQKSGLTFDDVRNKYPQYNDMSDEQLATGLHKKFYADMPFEQFASKIGYTPPKRADLAPPDPNIPQTDKDIPEGPLKQIGEAGIAGAKEAMENSDILTPKAHEALKGSPWGSALETGANVIGKGLAIPGAAYSGAMGALTQTGEEVGVPGLGPAVGAFSEAFPQESMGMRGVLERAPHVSVDRPREAERAPAAGSSPSEVARSEAPASPSPTPTLERMADEAKGELATPTMHIRPEDAAIAELEPERQEVAKEVRAEPEPQRSQEPTAPLPLRTIQQIMDEDGVGKRKAQETQWAEIEAIGRPVSQEDVAARAAGVQNAPKAEAPLPAPSQQPFERLPPEPQRLVNFLRAPWTDAQGNVHAGGIRDDGGDIKAIIGGTKGRPGLISRLGDNPDNATMRAWQAGFFPEFNARPMINDLLDKIARDHNQQPVYSMHDDAKVAAYEQAAAQNAEIDRLAAQHGIETRGITRDQFFDQLNAKLSEEDHAHKMQTQQAALDKSYQRAEAIARESAASVKGEPINLKELYGQSQARSLKDLEDEHQQIQQSEAAPTGEQRPPSAQEPGRAAAGEEPLPPSTRPSGDIAGPPGGEHAPTDTARAPEPAENLLGRPIARETARTPEPTIRNDPNQAAMPGMAPSAVQAQAARDQAGRGALLPKTEQKPADEGLFARPETPQPGLKLYAGPTAIFDPDAWRWLAGPLAKPTKAAIAAIRDIRDSLAKGIVPISQGTVRAQNFAASFANSLRRVMYRYGEIDNEIAKNFKPAEREAMGRALDAQSVFEQQFRDMSPDQQAAARQAFDQSGYGVAGLSPQQRHVVEMLDTLSQATWKQMQDRGMVDPKAKGVPYYFPRQILNWTEDEGFSRVQSSQAGAGRGIDQRGQNLTTAGPMRREHLTPEETEAAAKAKLGNQATLLRDIRSLPARLAFSQRAIAGVDLIKQIEDVGKSVGVDTVVHGDIPGPDYFTIADHPSFRRWTGTGWQATHVASEFEGPLKAVLTKASPTWYKAAAGIKGGVMSAIMYSPFIHLAVELGRALPVMAMSDPVGLLTLKSLRDGSTLRRDLDFMDQATTDGLAPLGRKWAADPVSIADQANVEGRNSFIAALGNARDAIANGAKAIGGQTLHDIVQHPHQTLLWDQVFNLQTGLYNQLRTNWIAKGYDPQVAGTMAAHIANRYAGALPAEHLSKAANMASNLLLFSRSFTLGNLGVMKDMFTGAPPHILARINEMAGPDVAKSAQGALRGKAIAAVTMDIGLFYVANGLLQAGLQAMRQGTDETENDWMNKAKMALGEVSQGNLLSAFGVLPQHWNEPGKQDRVFAGTDASGRGVYLRLPPGKVGEEFMNWGTKPGVMLEAKLSPLIRPIIEDIIGSDTLGRPLYPPNPQTIGDGLKIAWLAVKHIAEGLGPTSTIEGAHELWKSQIKGEKTQADPGTSALKILGPMTGLAQISSGYPGGPASGEMHAESEREKFQQQQAMPAIREKIMNGDIDGARQDMTALGVKPGLQSYYIRQTQRPGPTPAQQRQFMKNAPPEVKRRYDLQRQQ